MAHSSSFGEQKAMSILRVYSDEDGNSKFGSFSIEMKGTGDIGFLSDLVGCKGVIFRETPGDYCYSWHTAPCRQFIVNLDADVELEVTDGERRTVKQGEVFFVEDTTGRGHFSRAVDGRVRHSLFIPVKEDFVLDRELVQPKK